MQSEPTAVFDRSPLLDPPSEVFLDPTQHGNDSHGEHRVSGLRYQEPGDSSGGFDSSAVGQHSPLKTTEPAPLVDSVSQYENAIAHSARKEEEVKFRVKPSPIYLGVSLDAFPNGMSPHPPRPE